MDVPCRQPVGNMASFLEKVPCRLQGACGNVTLFLEKVPRRELVGSVALFLKKRYSWAVAR